MDGEGEQQKGGVEGRGIPTTGTSGSSSQVEVRMAFWCKIDNVRVVTTVLSTIHSKGTKRGGENEQQIASVCINKNGMKFTVEEARSFQANALLTSELFQEYHFADESVGGTGSVGGNGGQFNFRINFSVMMECLMMFSQTTTYTAMQMGYGGYGQPMIMMMEEGNERTQCTIRTMEYEEVTPINFRGTEVVNEVIVEAEMMKEAFGELDWSSTTVKIMMSPDAPYFQLSTEGAPGMCEVEYPNQPDVFEKFRCTKTQVNRYKLSVLIPTIRALAIAKKTQLRSNAAGVLCMQHMIQTEDRKMSFVDFLLLADDDPDDPDDPDDDAHAGLAPLPAGVHPPLPAAAGRLDDDDDSFGVLRL